MSKRVRQERDLLLAERLEDRKTGTPEFKEVDAMIQDNIIEIIGLMRYRKTNQGFAKAIYAGNYIEQLEKTCIRLTNLIERYKKIRRSHT